MFVLLSFPIFLPSISFSFLFPSFSTFTLSLSLHAVPPYLHFTSWQCYKPFTDTVWSPLGRQSHPSLLFTCLFSRITTHTQIFKNRSQAHDCLFRRCYSTGTHWSPESSSEIILLKEAMQVPVHFFISQLTAFI